MRRLAALLWVAAPFLAFLVWVYLPYPSTPVTRMMAEALPEPAAGVALSDAAQLYELSFVRSIAGPDDWVCYFWEYESIEEQVRRDTGRKTRANISSTGDQRTWALVIDDRTHVRPIWSIHVRDRRKGVQPPTYRKCTRVSETRVSRQGTHLVLEDAD